MIQYNMIFYDIVQLVYDIKRIHAVRALFLIGLQYKTNAYLNFFTEIDLISTAVTPKKRFCICQRRTTPHDE